MNFSEAQRTLRFHYQWMLINDFLPTLVNKKTLHSVLPHLAAKSLISENPPVLKFYHARDLAYMPLEFSVAAYRFGHSMIRPGYRLNDSDANAFADFWRGWSCFPSQEPSRFHVSCRRMGHRLARFIDIEPRPAGTMIDDKGNAPNGKPPTAQELEDNKRRLQLAYRIDTSIVFPLGNLPPDVADLIIPSLAERNLVRGWRLRLPNGQSVAKAIGEDPIVVKIGKFEDQEDGVQPIEAISAAFKDNCPLWTYCLAETHAYTAPGIHGVNSKLLGPVGGRIVAETFAGLLAYDSQSFFAQEPKWKPTIGDGKIFGLKEFVNFAIGK